MGGGIIMNFIKKFNYFVWESNCLINSIILSGNPWSLLQKSQKCLFKFLISEFNFGYILYLNWYLVSVCKISLSGILDFDSISKILLHISIILINSVILGLLLISDSEI